MVTDIIPRNLIINGKLGTMLMLKLKPEGIDTIVDTPRYS